MAKRKSKQDDFIMTCEKNKKLYTLAATSTPSCSLYDVIDRNFVISEKSTSYKKSSCAINLANFLSVLIDGIHLLRPAAIADT